MSDMPLSGSVDRKAREKGLINWLQTQLDTPFQCRLIFGDASFRRYFRVATADYSLIAVDAPPPMEDCACFIAVDEALKAVGIPVPQVHAYDIAQGYMLQEDFGDQQLLPLLNEHTVDDYYHQALAQLPALMSVTATSQGPLPYFDAAMQQREVELFTDWLLNKHLRLSVTQDERQQLSDCLSYLIATNIEQPQRGVHRDFHSRNLLVHGDTLGIIDFQDAVLGPICYDAVSLLRDCYIRWPGLHVERWVAEFYRTLVQAEQLSPAVSLDQFKHWFDMCGMQRHVKVAGIFARLNHRDGKERYLQDIPLALDYLIEVGARYAPTHWFSDWLLHRIKPAFMATLA